MDNGLEELTRNTATQREIKYRLDRIANIMEVIQDRMQAIEMLAWGIFFINAALVFGCLLYMLKKMN